MVLYVFCTNLLFTLTFKVQLLSISCLEGIMNKFKKLPIVLLSTGLVFGVSTVAHSSVSLASISGWEADVSGSIPVFFVVSDFEGDEDASRIMSGFNPANLTFSVAAPKSNGITVTSRVQIDTHLQGSQTQNSGLFESRVAEIQVDGDFGTVNVGKGFGIFNSSAIGDLGSGMGVGFMGGGPDTGNTTGGRIGTGYVYANFNPRIMYSSNNMGGITYKVGLFNPEEPTDSAGGARTSLPRFEGQVNYAMNMDDSDLKLWAGFMWQEVKLIVEDVDYDMQGLDIGFHLDIANFGFTGAYTDTEGVGADGLYGIGGISDAEVDGSQWYFEGDVVVGATTYGLSYGEGEQDSHTAPFAVADVKNELTMLFVRHKVTDNLTVMGELQDYESTTGSVTSTEYNAVAVGLQFDF